MTVLLIILTLFHGTLVLPTPSMEVCTYEALAARSIPNAVGAIASYSSRHKDGYDRERRGLCGLRGQGRWVLLRSGSLGHGERINKL